MTASNYVILKELATEESYSAIVRVISIGSRSFAIAQDDFGMEPSEFKLSALYLLL